jgi:hypothetical protein
MHRHVAVRNNKLAVLRLLARAGASVELLETGTGDSPFLIACKFPFLIA